MNKKVLGIITARGGSKGIPGKNIKQLCGKPLIAYSIEAAKRSKLLSRTIISTDDEGIAEVARVCGGDVPFIRPEDLATDTSKSIDAVIHSVDWLKQNEGEEYDYVMILQPTSPLRTSEDIDACIEKIITTGADSVMSMYELVDFSAKKVKKIENDLILSYFEDEGNQSAQRQTLARAYKRNCAIYLTKTELILKGDLFGTISRPYIMPDDRSVDINKQIDFEWAEFLISKSK